MAVLQSVRQLFPLGGVHLDEHDDRLFLDPFWRLPRLWHMDFSRFRGCIGQKIPNVFCSKVNISSEKKFSISLDNFGEELGVGHGGEASGGDCHLRRRLPPAFHLLHRFQFHIFNRRVRRHGQIQSAGKC